MGRIKVGIVSNPDRAAVIVKAFDRAGITMDQSIDASARPDVGARLAEWDAAGYDVAIIDDAAVADTASMVSAVTRFVSAPRAPGGRLRPILFGSAERSPLDDLYSKLASGGVYDLVIPGKHRSPLSKLVELVAVPARRSDVLALMRGGSAERAPAAPHPSSAPLEPATRLVARGRSVIAVSGIMPRAGASLASIAIARCLVMLGQIPALVVDQSSFEAYRSCYSAAPVGNDGRSVRINGVTVMPGTSASAPRSFTHTVLDLGYIGWGLDAPDEDTQRAVIEFRRADLQVVYITCSNPMERAWLVRFVRSQHPADMARYALAIWGATDEIYEGIERAIHSKAPDAYIWKMPPIMWPLQLSEVPEGIAGALEPVLPRQRKRAEPGEEHLRKPLLSRLFGKGEA